MIKKYKNNIYFFLLYISLLFVILSLVVHINYNDKSSLKASIFNSNINYKNETTLVDVNYPRFKDEKINELILNYIYEYVKKFRLSKKINKKLIIDYELYYYNEYINVVFKINNSIDNVKYKNILINKNTKKLSYITNLFDKTFIENKINEITYYKYSKEIYDLVKKSNINNHTYIINDEKIDVYFYDIKFKKIKYIPYITIKLNENVLSQNNLKKYEYDKFIAFTFDDGPTNYTSELLKTLELNNSSATFFMLGNRMKYNKDIVDEIYNSNSEIGSHTYSHKNLSYLTSDDAIIEINTTEIIYNEITNNKIKYLRPPYGNYNKNTLSLNYPLILWSIDPKDWLYRDETKIYNNVIKELCDGCIVLMHDTNMQTIEAVKKLIPALNYIGYNVVSISNLAEVKKYSIKNGEVVRKIK